METRLLSKHVGWLLIGRIMARADQRSLALSLGLAL